MRLWCIAVTGVIVSACATPPVAPSPKLQPPPGWAMAREPAIVPVPERDGDPAVRRDWYAQELSGRAQCQDKVGALQRYVRKVRE